MAPQSVLQGTVDFVNDVRRRHGADPIPDLIPGVPRNGCGCPITRSIEWRDGPRVVTNDDTVVVYDADRDAREIIYMPRAAREFVELFDSFGGLGGRYAELVEAVL